jgi:TatA/E family protein of Tat protein translocase
MLSIPHMIVVFLVVLVVFGPQKLPELARTFGKLMAEFRKASGEFKSAFEEEMRDLERQARIAELKKQASEAAAATLKNPVEAPTLASPPNTPEAPADSQVAEAPTVSPVAESVPRLDAPVSETAAAAESEAKQASPSHDQQQPA